MNKVKLIINNESESSALVNEVIINDKYLEVILIQDPIDETENYLTDLSCMFCGCKNLISIKKHIEHKIIDVEKVEDISYMFKDCEKIKFIDFALFSNKEKLNKMEYLFDNCKELIEIKDLEYWNTSNVTSMAYMFNGCLKLTKIDIGIDSKKEFKTENVTNFSKMFNTI